MESGSEKWLTELDLDEFIFVQRFQQSLSSENYSSYPLMAAAASSSSIETSSPALESTPVKDEAVSPMGAVKSQPLVCSKADKRNHSMISTPSYVQEHILKERKRRQQLSQQFIALFALVPGLQKMDKNTVLGDAIEYLKHLKERVKELEEDTTKRSVVFVKKFLLFDDEDDSSSSDESSTLPEIEARVSKKDVLIRIHCRKQQGIVAKILDQIEKLHLSIVNSIVLPFGNSTLVITIIAQMNAEFSTAVTDLVKSLRLCFVNFM